MGQDDSCAEHILFTVLQTISTHQHEIVIPGGITGNSATKETARDADNAIQGHPLLCQSTRHI